MIGLIKKDLLLILKSISATYIFGIVMPFFVVTQNPQFFTPILTLVISFLFAMQVTMTISLDENVRWRKYVTAMPIPAFYEAASKYIVTLLLAILSSLIVLVLENTIGRNLLAVNTNTIIVYTFLCFTIVLLYNAIAIPVSYKYGTARSRYIIMAFMAIPISIPYILEIFSLNISIKEVITNTTLFWTISITLVLILFIVSLLLSTKILKGLESGRMPDY